MKIRCKFKDPDTMQDSVVDAFAKAEKPPGITAQEWVNLRHERALEMQHQISERWMEYGEYLDVEFDTEANTATILPCGTIK